MQQQQVTRLGFHRDKCAEQAFIRICDRLGVSEQFVTAGHAFDGAVFIGRVIEEKHGRHEAAGIEAHAGPIGSVLMRAVTWCAGRLGYELVLEQLGFAAEQVADQARQAAVVSGSGKGA